METDRLIYYHEGTPCHGFIAWDESSEVKRPAILIAHAWRGQDDFARQKAIEIASMGYIGFAIDIYGEGKCVPNEEAQGLRDPFFFDRKLLQARMNAALDFIKKHPRVDPEKVAAIGFCFGGLCVYELLRSGADIKGVVTFHGIFAFSQEGKHVKEVTISSKILGKILVLHGAQDPLVSDTDLKFVQKEMTDANVDWQMHIFGNAMHAFTNPNAKDPKKGTLYDPISEKRAWELMQIFLDGLFI